MISFKGRHFPKDMMLMAVRWKVAYPLSYRNIEEIMEERGAEVEHSTVLKWVVHYAPKLEESFRKRKTPVGQSWKMDETPGSFHDYKLVMKRPGYLAELSRWAGERKLTGIFIQIDKCRCKTCKICNF